MWKNKELNKFYNHEFDFNNQYKNNYTDWLKAFENSVKKRAKNGCFMGLSSGYDSGAISNELLKQKINFKAYVVFNNENEVVLKKRLNNISNHQVLNMDKSLYEKYYSFLKGKINNKAIQDIASMGIAYMFETAKKEGRTICLSGQGGDEINSDYSLFPQQSTFKGKYPDELYEWANFRGNMQLQYLNGLEEIAALYGIEIRYPFLDINLIQEFLWLKVRLKNNNYKAPIFKYLTKNNVPFDKAVKKGFRPISI
uniref:Putative asparagine synthase n=1 Tax=viral metagenome TaxID=1070528 RepID=A0A6M3K351_9ZZZZ